MQREIGAVGVLRRVAAPNLTPTEALREGPETRG